MRIVLLAFLLPLVYSRLEAAIILPHGGEAFDPTILPPNTPARSAAEAIAEGARSAGQWLHHHIDPDVVFLSSPHGISLSKDFGIYLGNTASGSCNVGTDYNVTGHRVRARISLASHLSNELIDSLQDCNVSAVKMDHLPLGWGEIIPLSMIPAQYPTIILSHPLRRMEHAAEMVEELVQLGASIFEWMESRPERIAVVVSGDLSHAHQAAGPYGYSNTSEPMDHALGEWAKDPCNNSQWLLETARRLQSRALSCGFTGFCMLHGMLCGGSQYWDSHLLVNRNATYFGMMAAHFERLEASQSAASSL
jgi:aromatic ring-opening dioxygenase LigB subunit